MFWTFKLSLDILATVWAIFWSLWSAAANTVAYFAAPSLTTTSFITPAAAVSQFEGALGPAENRIAGKLKKQCQNKNGNTLQFLQEFKRYKELIKFQRHKTFSSLLLRHSSLECFVPCNFFRASLMFPGKARVE